MYGSNECYRHDDSLHKYNADIDFATSRSTPKNGRGAFLGVLIFFTIAGALSFFGFDMTQIVPTFIEVPVDSSEPMTAPKVVSNTSFVSEVETTLEIKASNEYGYFSAPYPWLVGDDIQLVEPYKNTTLTASGTLLRGATLYWSSDYETGVEYEGNPITLMFKKTGKIILTVEARDSKKGKARGRQTFTLISKYVKRELRSLTVVDREKFLDAAATLWQYSTTEGRKIFGKSYTSAATFVEEHALASNDIRCDSYHEGSGFITHHLAITNSFEAALRSVDPSVTLPYWDFTIEGQRINDENQDPSYFMQITPFLSDEWFGSVDSDGHIQDSRWAHSQMPKVSGDSVVSPNSFGYIRSYWNNNNDDEVTRHPFQVCGEEASNKKVPDCSSHYDVLNTADLAAFQLLSPSDGHGPVHVHLGGIAGQCVGAYKNFSDKWSYILDANMTAEEVKALGFEPSHWEYGYEAPRRKMLERNFVGEYFHIYRSLWRSHMCSRDATPNLLKCPESCSDDMSVEECQCKVDGLDDGTTDWENVYYCVLAGQNQEQFNKLMPKQLIIDMVTLVSTASVVEGEMLESASPADITFWVIHPTIDRLLTAKRLTTVTSMGTVDFAKWASVDGLEEAWLSYSYYSLEENENEYYTDAYTCVGHADTDQVLPDRLPLIDNFPGLADKDENGIITNWEYFVAIDPNNVDGVDYVYDNFDWVHCNGALNTKVGLPAKKMSLENYTVNGP